MSNVRRISERHKAKARAASPEKYRDDYWALSKLPLHSLVFLVPLIVLYELGSIAYLRDPAASVTMQIRAEALLNVFFEFFGVLGLMVPGITLAVVLLVMHVARKDRWTVRPMVVVAMGFESAVWVLPLIVLAAAVSDAAARMTLELVQQGGGGAGGVGSGGIGSGGAIHDLPWQARATIAVGAGVYEELLFRLIGIAVVDMAVSLLTEDKRVRAMVCVAVTAVCFAFYHDAAFVADPVTGQGIGSWLTTLSREGVGAALARVHVGNALFFVAAGVYFAVIYLTRGFGVVVGTHAAYDVAVLVLLATRG